MKRIILASGSPRRKELLEQVGLEFEVIPSDYEEDLSLELGPHDLAKALSLGKVQDVANKHRDAVVIGADSLLVFEGRGYGKPADGKEVKELLSRLSGKRHEVVTGLTIIEAGVGRVVSKAVETKVYFRKLTEGEIEAYVASGEPMGKAGAYAIQGLGAVLIEKIEGDFYNVVGLPVAVVAESLKEFGVEVL
jgi:septum formation protein